MWYDWKSGLEVALEGQGIRDGLNVVAGQVCYAGVAEAFRLDYVPVGELLSY